MRTASLLAAAIALGTITASHAADAPQYVLISFDGANDNALWERSLRLGDETSARFTYFLSCVYLLPAADRGIYNPPGLKTGRSNVGFATSRADATARLGHIWSAHVSGHEIASHGCGHFDGKDWTTTNWRSELRQFSTILSGAWEINGATAPAGWSSVEKSVRGFRAPYLSAGSSLMTSLEAVGYAYDASGVSRGVEQPVRKDSIVQFALPMIQEGPKSRRIIAMDYNLFVRHSGGIDRPSGAEDFAERTYQAFRAAFEAEFNGQRRPLQMGFHFQLMNGGAYWDALERFARETCGRADVRCVTYTNWMNGNADPRSATAAGG